MSDHAQNKSPVGLRLLDHGAINGPFPTQRLLDRFPFPSRYVYLMAVIEETLRLHPPVPKDMKVASKKDVLPDGTFVPAGYWVVYAIWATQRDKQIWGADAEEFRPERWLARGEIGGRGAENVEQSKSGNTGRQETGGKRKLALKMPRPSQFEFPVFNAGPRLCLGLRMAYIEAQIVLVELLRNIEFRSPR